MSRNESIFYMFCNSGLLSKTDILLFTLPLVKKCVNYVPCLELIVIHFLKCFE